MALNPCLSIVTISLLCHNLMTVSQKITQVDPLMGQRRWRRYSIESALNQRLVFPEKTFVDPILYLTLSQRLWLWANIRPKQLVSDSYPRKHETLNRCWAYVGPASKTLVQHRPNIGSTSLRRVRRVFYDRTQWSWSNSDHLIRVIYLAAKIGVALGGLIGDSSSCQS